MQPVHPVHPVHRALERPAADPLREYRPEARSPELELFTIDETDPRRWDRAERFVYDTFRVSGFCEESPRGWVEEMEPYRSGSSFHVVSGPSGMLGVVRTMLDTYERLPIGQFGGATSAPAGPMCEIGSLAVRPSVRGLGVTNDLHRAAVQWALVHGAEGFCMLVEPWAIEFFRDVYGVPLVQPAPGRDYMGSVTVPAYITFESLLDHFSSHRPGMYHWITEGVPGRLLAERQLPIRLS